MIRPARATGSETAGSISRTARQRSKQCVSTNRDVRNGRRPITWRPRIAAGHPEQGWSMLCNGVIVFDDGELLPDGRAIPPAAPAAAGPLAMAA